jgi:hypothetical protein
MTGGLASIKLGALVGSLFFSLFKFNHNLQLAATFEVALSLKLPVKLLNNCSQ